MASAVVQTLPETNRSAFVSPTAVVQRPLKPTDGASAFVSPNAAVHPRQKTNSLGFPLCCRLMEAARGFAKATDMSQRHTFTHSHQSPTVYCHHHEHELPKNGCGEASSLSLASSHFCVKDYISNACVRAV